MCRLLLTTSTDVLTTSDTLCLSSAAVPGLPRPRVNLLVSGCAAAAIAARQLRKQRAFNPRVNTGRGGFRGRTSLGFLRFLRSPLVNAASLKRGAAAHSAPTSQSHTFRYFFFFFFSHHASRSIPVIYFSPTELIVVMIKSPREKCAIGRASPAGRCIIRWPPRCTPPLAA